MAYIYKITNPKGEVYIGSTRQKMYQRKAEHKYNLKRGRSGLVYGSFSKYGFDNHSFDVLTSVDEDDRVELEHFIIKEFNTKLNEVKEHNATAVGKIWVNNGFKEFQILPETFESYENIKKGRLTNKN